MADEVQEQSAFFGLSGVGVVETYAQTGRLGRVNAMFCDLLGYGEAELRELKRRAEVNRAAVPRRTRTPRGAGVKGAGVGNTR